MSIRTAAATCAAVLALLAGAAGAAAQRRVDVEVFFAETTVLVGATVEYVITVEAEGRDRVDISPAAMPAGLVVTGQNQSSSLDVRVPGGVTRVQRLALSVLARSPGVYTVPGPGVRVAGTLVRGGEASITVVGGGGDAGITPPESGADDISVRAILERDTVYVGEPVELNTEVLLSDAARRRLRGAPQYFPPTPSGFLIHDLGSGARRFARAGDGRRFEIQRFRRAFVPLEAGTFRLPPARVELDMRRSLFDPSFPDVVESGRPTLVVLDLPASGRPDDFQGAVGRYRVAARLQPGATTAGDGVRLEVTVTGSGYVKPLPAPALRPATGLELLSPMEEADIRTTNQGLEGDKTFSWIVVPERPGTFELPEVRYPYFDPDLRRYAVARSAPLRLEVRGAPADGGTAPATLAALREHPAAGGPSAWVASPWFAVGQGAPLVAVLFAFFGFGRRLRTRPTSRGEADRGTRGLLQHWTYADAQGRSAALRSWLADRLEMPGLRGAPGEDVVAAVRESGIRETEARALAGLLASLDATRYGRSGDVAMDGDAGRELIKALDRSLPAPALSAERIERARRRFRAAGYATLTLGLACLVWAAVGTASAEPVAFGAGVEALRGGDAALAAANFAGHVRDHPEDATGWYNLGLAEADAGRNGRAIWAWLNALRRAPGDDDAAANARALGAQEASIARARGRPPASAPWLAGGAATALYLMALLALGGAARAGRRRARVAVPVAGAFAILLLGASALRERASPLAVPLREVALRYEPVRAGEAAQLLEPGAALVPRERRGSWVRVGVLRRGSDPLAEGWIEAAAMARVGASALP
ncbi:MAG TPA: BatD family protein [Longimicrobiales bacterium]|nr:BatD family protein [Longimicrobiales bacterium]